MAPWAWFLIWSALIVGAIATFAYIGLSIRDRAAALRPELDLLAQNAQVLAGLLDAKSDYVRPMPDTGQDPAIAVDRRRKLVRAREAKRQARERRLIEHLKHIEIDESRFS